MVELGFTIIAFVALLPKGLIGKIGGQPDFNAWRPGGLPFGAFVTAVVAFLIIAAVVYFLVVFAYTKAKARISAINAADLQALARRYLSGDAARLRGGAGLAACRVGVRREEPLK